MWKVKCKTELHVDTIFTNEAMEMFVRSATNVITVVVLAYSYNVKYVHQCRQNNCSLTNTNSSRQRRCCIYVVRQNTSLDTSSDQGLGFGERSGEDSVRYFTCIVKISYIFWYLFVGTQYFLVFLMGPSKYLT